MTIDDLLDQITEWLKGREDVASASRIDGEPAVGFETQGGQEFFITAEHA